MVQIEGLARGGDHLDHRLGARGSGQDVRRRDPDLRIVGQFDRGQRGRALRQVHRDAQPVCQGRHLAGGVAVQALRLRRKGAGDHRVRLRAHGRRLQFKVHGDADVLAQAQIDLGGDVDGLAGVLRMGGQGQHEAVVIAHLQRLSGSDGLGRGPVQGDMGQVP